MRVTKQEALTAGQGMKVLATIRMPFAAGLKVAKLRARLNTFALEFDEARTIALQAAAPVDANGDPEAVDIEQDGRKGVAYKVSATAQMRISREIQHDLATEVEFDDVEPLTAADFPRTVEGKPFVIEPETLAALGPFLQ